MEQDLATHLIALEVSLHDPDTRRDAVKVASLLSDDFREFGASGRVWSRTEILSLLHSEPAQAITSRGFECQQLSPMLALLTYTSHNGTREALRSSLWRLEDGL